MIRKARENEHFILTEISCLSKTYWDYRPEQMEIFKRELKITPEYIRNNIVWVLELDDKIMAYYSLMYLKEDVVYEVCTLKKGYWLDHMFIHPDYIKKGLGSTLFKHLVNYINQNNIDAVQILADPHSKTFYEKMGAVYISDYPSSIKGRTTPYLIYKTVR